MDFFFRDTAKFYVLFIHWDIDQIIQVAEYAYFTEFSYPCQKTEFDTSVFAF